MVAEHAVLVRGASLGRTFSKAPVILARPDRQFLQAILDGLSTPDGREEIASTIAARRDAKGILKLHLPMHRIQHVALIDIACDGFMNPRLDPTRVDSAGLVLRRINPDNPSRLQGWRNDGKTIVGWKDFSTEDDERADPDLSRRPPPLHSGQPALDRQLAPFHWLKAQPYNEGASPLFVAPPAVCQAAGRTFLYGVIPLASSEQVETATPPPPYDVSVVSSHLPAYFRAGGQRAIARAGETLTASNADDANLADFILMLRQLVMEFGFRDAAIPNGALYQTLRQFALPSPANPSNAGDFFDHALQALVERMPGVAVTMPPHWPAVSAALSASILSAIQSAIQGRIATLATREGRFDNPTALYQLRAFVRVKRGACPTRIYWSDPTETFTIAAWYESGGQPPVRIQLPDLNNGFLKALKPDVSFGMSQSTFQKMNGDAKEMLKGNFPGGGGLDIAWLCSFNIPTITFCAFFVLNIFLSLFDIIFGWMLFVKLCIPIPKRK